MISKQLLNEMRVGLLAPPSDRTRTISHTVFLNHRWYWYMQVHNTPNQHIQKISLSLFETQPTPHQNPLFTTAGYRYV